CAVGVWFREWCAKRSDLLSPAQESFLNISVYLHSKQETKMAIGFPTYTVILFIVATIGTGIGSWLILSEGLAKLPIAPHIKRIWRWGAAIVLIAWLLVLLAWSVNPPGGGVVLGRAVTVTFLVSGLLAGILPLLISPSFRQIVRRFLKPGWSVSTPSGSWGSSGSPWRI